ncbi:LysR family transcriptional regulator [Methylobacterium sp. J-059]|jgi:molybdate transport system regulatory protein|uniref:winged helix-turn-helix domain-containing protein n=1 Tax=Methylobacterium sp. J-059 TaxID=2836643 RepID=UPI001FB89B28|nr:LysR family transcriptional regulator [Methylobacterium sp. J-059]MCJ2041997.1 LysR family transcriptional regulator [Methylobacterium sp. J-059]
MATLSIRIDLGPGNRLGPGKVQLLEMIAAHGSISAAGRALGMSYRRAWMLVEAINAGFRQPVVEAQIGGRSGGGARLSAFGAEVVAQYRAVERLAAEAAAPLLVRLEGAAADPSGDRGGSGDRPEGGRDGVPLGGEIAGGDGA